MTESIRPRRFAAVCGLFCTAAVLTACGGSADLTTPTIPVQSTTASTTPTTASATSSAPTTAPTSAPSDAATTEPVAATADASPATPPPNNSPAKASAKATVPDQRDAITYDHPNLGPVTITIAYAEPTEATRIVPTVRATVDSTGETVFEWTGEDGYSSFDFAGAEFNPAITNPVDKRGHVFFEWDPGRYPGVSYLVTTPTGFDSNGSMGASYSDGHYVALLVDTDGDGNYEIKQGFDNCDPSCAEGYVYSHIWSWDGSAYTGSDNDPGRNAAEPLGDASQLEPAKTAFTDYLLAVGARDYKKAWGMLEPDYQDKYGGYDKFTAFWDTIDSVGIDSLYASWGYGTTTLEGTLWFQLKKGTRQTEDVTVSMSYGDPPKIANYVSYGTTE